MCAAVDDLFRTMREVIARAVNLAPHSSLFDPVAARFAVPAIRHHHEPRAPPVVGEWLDRALDAATGPFQQVAKLLRAASDELVWVQSYPHLDSTPAVDAFRDFYSYTALAMPLIDKATPVFELPDVLVGFTIQAPGVLYPHHHHEPPELYGVISGAIDWQIGSGPWSTKRAGELIAHRPNESHSMRTTDTPGLSWVLWPGNIEAAVYMPSLDPPDQTTAPTDY